jgi:hypothetical protein
MKKTILVALSVLAMTYAASAQNDLTFGLKAGVNYSNVYDSEGEQFNADPKLGLAAGAFLSIPLGKYFGIQPEVLFSQKGFKATGTMFGSTYNVTRTTNYIDVPLFLALKPTETITLLAGPQFAYLIKQKDVFSNPSGNFQQETEFKNDNIRKNILCFIAGLDVNLNHTVLGARAGWDLSNNNGNGSSSTPRYKNAWLQATIGFRF